MSDSIGVCVSFDTTGSMYPCLTQVRRYIGEMVGKLFKDIPDLRIAIIAHGDYCDEGNPYTVQMLDFSKDEEKIKNFVTQVEPTYGGDAPECYELILHEARTSLSWESGRGKAPVIIGDDVPHGPNEKQNKQKINWRKELEFLLEAGILNYNLKNCISKLQNETLSDYQSDDDITPVPEGRFHELFVDKEMSIKTFILEQGNSFKVGEGGL